MLDTDIQVKIQKFDGPLGLLLQLIQKEEIEIKDLDINKITDQYLHYINQMNELNFDVAGDYLYMASTLLYIKSKSVSEDEAVTKENLDFLPSDITTKTQLIQRLEELERFKNLGDKLWELPRKNEEIFIKPKVDRKAIQSSILQPIDLQNLTGAMIDILKREKRKYTVVKRDKISIKEKLIELKKRLAIGSETTLEDLINREKGTDEIVITFISLLELARLSKLRISQDESQGSITVSVVGSIDDLDVESANGFDAENEDTPEDLLH